jgi:hypothetical protein
LETEQVVPARGCTLCITTGGAGRPATVPAATRVVGEEWLFDSIEVYEALPLDRWLVS